ncbi:MAG TPA: family 14 glycosylhydrolase [Candidatus Dormibacteraeota bacterium]|nr:family 14 glycosylhydrolase [Candidatus Dormibacteraeota bacterium]
MKYRFIALAGLLLADLAVSQSTNFDGRPWNVSSGNLSVSFIQGSPIGAFPKTNYLEAPPSLESQAHAKSLGLVANEDYVAWGAVEREAGHWQWEQHDAMERRLHQAGLKYVVYDWVHFPPVWLRDTQKDKRTLMRCLEHGKEANYLSVFDPRTIQWYDHFFRNLHEHFGNRIDDVYACILGPYGEGNYPLMVPDWVNMGHCHEGYWCGDDSARASFRAAMRKQYVVLWKLNRAWGTGFTSWDQVVAPSQIANEKFKPSPAAFPTPRHKRRWLDFITWYHQAIIDFAEQSARTVLKYFPATKVRMKPGGTAAGVNPISWGTYCPGYAKMAHSYGIVLQPADCQGAVFADKWAATAYQFYHVTECTEPAGGLDDKTFVQRMFSDASCGASQFFTYEFEKHAADMQKYIHLLTGVPGEIKIAVYCPTSLYRLGGDLQPTIKACYPLRDLCEFDVLDEQLISDGALTTNRYKALVVFQADIVDQSILRKFDRFLRRGGKIIQVGKGEIKDVEGQIWKSASKVIHVSPLEASKAWVKELAPLLNGLDGVDGALDGLWTCRRGKQVFVFNSTGKPLEANLNGVRKQVPPYAIAESSQSSRVVDQLRHDHPSQQSR